MAVKPMYAGNASALRGVDHFDKEKVISRSALERESKQVAERLSALYG